METVAAVHLDTHVVVWLYQKDEARLLPALRHIAGRRPIISPMALLELQYLHEVGRTRPTAEAIFAELSATLGLRIARSSFADVARRAWALGWTRDPFDRLIVATALVDGAPLVTRDEVIRANVPSALWG